MRRALVLLAGAGALWLGVPGCKVDPLASLGRPCSSTEPCGPGASCDPHTHTCVAGSPPEGGLDARRDARRDAGTDRSPARDLLGGVDYPPIPDGPCHYPMPPTPSSPVTAKRSDILFVIDNSGSMGTLNSQLASKLSALEAKLSHFDYRIGVVTADLGVSKHIIGGCTECGDDGVLEMGASCLSTGSEKYLASASGKKNYSGSLSSAFSCVLSSLGQNGCGLERTFHAAAVALTSKGINQGFLRPDASLVIVLHTNEDDCSAKDLSLFDPLKVLLGHISYRCFAQGITCSGYTPFQIGVRTSCAPKVGGMLYDVSAHVAMLQAVRPGRVGLVAIAGPTSPIEVVNGSNGAELKPSCTTPGNAYPGIRVKALTAAFGSKGYFFSICSEVDSAISAVAQLAESL